MAASVDERVDPVDEVDPVGEWVNPTRPPRDHGSGRGATVRSAGRRPVRARLGWLLLVGSLVGATACGGGGDDGDTAAPHEMRHPGSVHVLSLASENGERYEYAKKGDVITVSAPESNEPVLLDVPGTPDKNIISETFWTGNQPRRADQRICVESLPIPDASTKESLQRFSSDPTLAQVPGVALRARPGKRAGVPIRSLVVAPYVSVGVMWRIRVLAFTNEASETGSIANVQEIGVMDFGDVVGTLSDPDADDFTTDMKPPPWHMCAQALGSELSVMVWTGDEKQPSWDDPDRVHTVEVPRKWVYQGYAGAYLDALAPGRSVDFDAPEITSAY